MFGDSIKWGTVLARLYLELHVAGEFLIKEGFSFSRVSGRSVSFLLLLLFFEYLNISGIWQFLQDAMPLFNIIA